MLPIRLSVAGSSGRSWGNWPRQMIVARTARPFVSTAGASAPRRRSGPPDRACRASHTLLPKICVFAWAYPRHVTSSSRPSHATVAQPVHRWRGGAMETSGVRKCGDVLENVRHWRRTAFSTPVLWVPFLRTPHFGALRRKGAVIPAQIPVTMRYGQARASGCTGPRMTRHVRRGTPCLWMRDTPTSPATIAAAIMTRAAGGTRDKRAWPAERGSA